MGNTKIFSQSVREPMVAQLVIALFLVTGAHYFIERHAKSIVFRIFFLGLGEQFTPS